jgi:hypothetical protein
MLSSAQSTPRVFFVAGVPSTCNGTAVSDAESLTFAELPLLPLTVSHLQGGGAAAAAGARPLVSPMLHLGRHSPLLRASLGNDRRWSRKLLEVTTWCIHGLPSHADAVCPIDEATLPFAGVRVRLCGGGGPVRVVPRRQSERRGVVALNAPDACAWLQHGDVLEFGSCARLRMLAVHMSTSPAAELAQKASYVWVQAAGATAGAGTPVAIWSARLANWSTIPKFLKAKMLLEAAVLLVQQEALQEAETLQLRLHTTSTQGPTLQQGNLATGAVHCDVSHRCSEARQEACMAAGDTDDEAATPTSESQKRQRLRLQQHQQREGEAYSRTNSPQQLRDRGQTRSAPSIVGTTAEGRVESYPPPRPTYASQGATSPPLRRTMGGPALQPLSSRLSARYSLAATFSETMDDKLHEALLNLENEGTDIGDALLHRQQQPHEPAVLLGAMEEDLSGPRGTSSERGVTQHLHTSPPTRRETGKEDNTSERRRCTAAGEAAPQQQRQQQGSHRHSSKRAGRGRQRRRSASRKNASDADEESRSSHKRRRASSDSVSLSQPLLKDIDTGDVARAAPLTRADIKRLRTNEPPQEDSQVVFFDH